MNKNKKELIESMIKKEENDILWHRISMIGALVLTFAFFITFIGIPLAVVCFIIALVKQSNISNAKRRIEDLKLKFVE